MVHRRSCSSYIIKKTVQNIEKWTSIPSMGAAFLAQYDTWSLVSVLEDLALQRLLFRPSPVQRLSKYWELQVVSAPGKPRPGVLQSCLWRLASPLCRILVFFFFHIVFSARFSLSRPRARTDPTYSGTTLERTEGHRSSQRGTACVGSSAND